MKKTLIIIFTILIITICLCGAAYTVYRFMFMPNDRMVPAFEEGRLNVVVEGEIARSSGQAKLVDEQILLPLDIIREYIDPNINWDDKLHKVTITTKDRVIRMKTDSLDAFVNNKPVTLNIPATEENGTVLIPIEFLSEFYNIEISYIKENNVVIIDFLNHVRQVAEPVDTKAVVRTGRSIFFPIVKKLDATNKKENELRVFEEYEKWYKVRTSDGAVGYIEKKYVVVKMILVKKMPAGKDAGTPWKPDSGKLNMAWDYAYNIKFNLSKKPKINGLDVISPTWFQVTGEDGTLKNSADLKYVNWAHNNNYKVWALFSNNFGDPVKSGNFLHNTDSRDNAIRQLLAFAALYKLEGINIDFENLLDSDRDAYTQFIRELAPILREQGLIVSIDINTMRCYDRKALGDSADYVALMAYDQHWKGGSEAGSVAEVGWVEKTVANFLNDIPAEKLILGIPFYTRVWKEEPGADGKINLTSQALSMVDAKKLLDENKASVSWEDKSGQFYGEYKQGGATYKVWLEDANSINLRTSLILKYRLVGAAAWRLDFEEPGIWETIDRNLKTINSFSDWKLQNEGKNHVYVN